MTGLEKILNRINSDSEAVCSSIIGSAQKECDEILAAAKKRGEEAAAGIKAAAEAEGKKLISMAESGAAQQTSQTLLAARVDAVNETVAALSERLKALPDGEYFAAVIRLAGENAMKGSCTAKLCKKDLARLPSDFAGRLASALEKKGAVCTLSDEEANIDSGIILDYGDIVINCSFDAIIEDNIDIYKEKISKIIF